MYYAHFILSKKGPLAKIWLAAHWDKKLTKAQIYETNIESTIETILEPKMKLALRTSGHLLVGVCRIYSRKIKYLLADCNEAFVKIKMAFRPGLVDLPKEKQQANVDAITLQEKFPEFDINFVDINMEDIDLSSNLTLQQARIEDITLKEDYGHMIITQDDDFGDMGFGMGSLMMGDGDRDLFREHENDITFNRDDNITSLIRDKTATEFGENEKMEVLEDNNGEKDVTLQERGENDEEMISSSIPVVPTLFEEQTTIAKMDDEPLSKMARTIDGEEKLLDSEKENQELPLSENKTNQSVVPLAVNQQILNTEKQRQTRRRKKLIVDEIKEIDSVTMKAQLSDTSNIVATLELAPPTRQLMHWKESGTIEKLFMNTSRELNCKVLQRIFKDNMVTKKDVEIVSKKNQQKSGFASSLMNSINEASVQERQRDDNNELMNNDNLLPFADSFVDGNEVSKRQLDINSINNTDLNDGAGGDVTLTMNNETVNLSLDAPQTVFNNFELNDIEKLEETPLAKEQQHEKRKSTTHHRKSHQPSVKEDLTIQEDLNEESINDQMKVLSKRAKTMISLLNKNLNKHSNVGLFELTRRNGRKQAAQKFYSLLLLKKFDVIELSQCDMYEDIILSKGEKFDNFIMSTSFTSA